MELKGIMGNGTEKHSIIPIPRACTLELTYDCNHTCPFCSNRWKNDGGHYPRSRLLSGKEWIGIIKKVAEIGIENIFISGGEPTLHQDFLQIIDFLLNYQYKIPYYISDEEIKFKSKSVKFTLLTNGDNPIFTHKLLERLSKSGNIDLSITLVGNREFYLKEINGDFEKIIQTIHNAVDVGLNPSVSIPIYKSNVHLVKDLLVESIEIGVKRFLLMRAIPFGTMNKEKIVTNVSDLRKLLRKIDELASRILKTGSKSGQASQIEIAMGTLMPKCKFDNSDYEYIDFYSMCNCGILSFCIDPSARIRPCSCSEIIIGHSDNIIEALNSKKNNEFIHKIHNIHPSYCNGCLFLDECSAGCPAGWYYSDLQNSFLDVSLDKNFQ
ncbi:MAG: radical SAM protein [Candidatus Lokiarchaeota archaeon]|nr:radical SAM protein [Candidatus Lokiarchaeota archaeon]